MATSIHLIPDGRSDDHRSLAQTVHDVAARSVGSEDRGWSRLAVDLGAAGLAAPEVSGGVGADAADLLVLHEELGYWSAGGDLVAHHLAMSVLGADGLARLDEREAYVTGARRAAAHVNVTGLTLEDSGELRGVVEVFVSAPGADLLVVRAQTSDRTDVWCGVDPASVALSDLELVDLSRRAARIDLAGARPVTVVSAGPEATQDAWTLEVALHAAEAVGGMRRCLDLSVQHATQRHQFDRAIGSFQALKHILADNLVRLEEARASLAAVRERGVADPTTVAVAQRLTVPGYLQSAQELIQVLGGLGFTWEHEAHIHLRRAMTVQTLVARLPVKAAADARLEAPRTELGQRARAWFESRGTAFSPLSSDSRRMDADKISRARSYQASLAEAGLAGLTWPVSLGGQGLGPDAVRDVVRASAGYETFADVTTITLGIVAPLLLDHGTPDQQQTYLPRMLGLEDLWCQLFSEPGAGSDLAGVTTRARREGDHFVVTGQKVWTTNAYAADRGLLLARTDPTTTKHRGLTLFIVDMTAPGVEVRPIQQITGETEFCEVFLDELRLPATAVLGEVDGGWSLALATLAYERIALGSGAYQAMVAGSHEAMADVAGQVGRSEEPGVRGDLEDVLVHERAFIALSSLLADIVEAGENPGAAVSVAKMLSARLAHQVADLGLRLAGPTGVAAKSGLSDPAFHYLYAPSTSIAGGTSQVQRTILAEQLLGLPREPRVTTRPTA